MNENLRETIKQLRSSLVALDDGPRIGEIRPGNADARFEVESWDDVLVECDGGRFGAIDLWSAEEIPSCQQAIQPLDNASDYLVVGQILYEPIVINRRSELLHWLPVNAQPVALGTADLFLNHFVFGSGYSELIPDVEKEHWWQFLSSQRIT
ncbi:hypothetical protein [Gimesia chilikensis]|uniref:hypothetical protein n=1 Tax=Gimesia chilikensis TaxID=2605989 RepID=UPI003A8E67B8